MRVLITGATGIVGSELLARAPTLGCEVKGSSAHGDASRGVCAWQMDQDAPPDELAGPWDVIVHAAASTQWNIDMDAATRSNIEATKGAIALAGPSARFVHLSTTHCIGKRDSTVSEDPNDYRNLYEWSKAASERIVAREVPYATIIRFPIVIGRRSDGAIARFPGFYRFLGALVTGLMPAIVGDPDGFVDIVPVDDLATIILELATDGGPDTAEPVVIGRGEGAMSVTGVLDLFYETVNRWRCDRGIPSLTRPPTLSPERWERFFRPFLRQHASAMQVRAVDLFGHFLPYMCLDGPFTVNRRIDAVDDAIRRCLLTWADAKPRTVGATPRPWRKPDLESATVA